VAIALSTLLPNKAGLDRPLRTHFKRSSPLCLDSTMWGCCNDDHVFTYGAEMLSTDFNGEWIWMDLVWCSIHGFYPTLIFLTFANFSVLNPPFVFSVLTWKASDCCMLKQLNPGVDLRACAVSKDLHSSSPDARLGKPRGEFRVCSRVATSQLRRAWAHALLVLVYLVYLVWPLVTCWSPCFKKASPVSAMLLNQVTCCAGSYWLRYCAAGVDDVLWMLVEPIQRFMSSMSAAFLPCKPNSQVRLFWHCLDLDIF